MFQTILKGVEMSYIKFLRSLMVLPLLMPVVASAESPVWKVTKGDEVVYVGGTIHVLNQNDYPLPTVFDTAYQNSQKLVFEVDTEAMNSPQMQQKMAALMMNTSGENWLDLLSEMNRKKLTEEVTKLGLPLGQLSAMNPNFAILMIYQMDMVKKGLVNAEGVEKFYTRQGKKDQKSFGHLETIEQQLALLSKDPDENFDQDVGYFLEKMAETETIWNDLRLAWRTGDFDTLEKLTIDEFKEYPDVYDEFLVERNHNWIPQIEAMFDAEGIEFVMVGAAHLVGEDGVLKLLKEKGYLVEPLKNSQ
ncbi:TraB/GumN family protein [Porticoccaceae bacterium LTM1]|nr:TraB/GumN family protein [Porticoccaceae bacterium LTM1]